MLERTLRLGVVLGMGLLLLGATPNIVTPANNRVLAAPEDHAPGAEFEVAKGAVFHRKPVGQALRAVLGQDLSLTFGAETVELRAGAGLTPARQIAGAGGSTIARADVYCAQLGADFARGRGSLGGVAQLLVGRRTPSVPRLCLIDADRDGIAEQALVVGTRLPDDQSLRAIPPTPVTTQRDVPLPGESEMRLRFAGRVGLLGNLGIDLEVVEEGRPLAFSNARTIFSAGKLPHEVMIMGARFTVLAYDPASQTARLRWTEGFAPADYGVETVETTTYIPIFIPR